MEFFYNIEYFSLDFLNMIKDILRVDSKYKFFSQDLKFLISVKQRLTFLNAQNQLKSTFLRWYVLFHLPKFQPIISIIVKNVGGN